MKRLTAPLGAAGLLAAALTALPAVAQDRSVDWARQQQNSRDQDWSSQDRQSRTGGDWSREAERRASERGGTGYGDERYDDRGASTRGTTGTASAAGSVEPADHQLARGIALSNQRGVEMAQVCAAQADNNQLVDHCRQTVQDLRDGTRRLATLTGDRQLAQAADQQPQQQARGKGVDKTDLSSVLSEALGLPGTNGQQAQAADPRAQERHRQTMATLQQASGEEFDYAFLTEMIRYHRDGERMAGACQDEARNADIQQSCRRAATMHARNSDRLAGWQEDWFDNRTSSRDR
ncbi:MAG TPA: DUF305 domain-containing protein [Azospirillaceae bacterium]|nr:DUF305 domain-containing protein [Azospirillaceae bacterium]